MEPLEGLRVIELAGIGPGPYCDAMLLPNLGPVLVQRFLRAGSEKSPSCTNVDLS